MQSYSSQEVLLTEESLSTLGSMLKLPQGWKYRVVKLNEEFHVPAPNSIGKYTLKELCYLHYCCVYCC